LEVAAHVERKAEMHFPIDNTLSSRWRTSPRRLETMRDLCCSVDIARRHVVFGAKFLLQRTVLYFQSIFAALCFRLGATLIVRIAADGKTIRIRDAMPTSVCTPLS